jgi:hypothetical protein
MGGHFIPQVATHRQHLVGGLSHACFDAPASRQRLDCDEQGNKKAFSKSESPASIFASGVVEKGMSRGGEYREQTARKYA